MKNKSILILFFIGIIGFVKAQQGLGEWTWMKGSNLPNSLGNFGTQGVSAPTNNPPALYEGYEWTDLNGNFWLFGGVANSGFMHNALWKFDPLTNNWTWIRGSSAPSNSGIYGVQGVSAPNNEPGARGWGGLSWVDNAGDLWLFGGFGFDAFGSLGTLNDLWRYNITSNEWVWMKGSNTITGAATVISGVKGVPNIANTPDGRQETNAGIADALGNLWLFGGIKPSGNTAYNDVWKFNISSNIWTWMAGNQTGLNSVNYGTQNMSAPSNDPGDRYCYTKFVDSQNNLYFLGARLSNISGPDVCDVWRFSSTTSEWTWVGGANLLNDLGAYLNYCNTVSLNHPLARFEIRASWADSCGFFFFGGFANSSGSLASYNDLWYYNVETNKFTWISGPGIANSAGSFGTMGVSATPNLPRSRGGALAFKDKQANLWLFGGGATSSGTVVFDRLNDLWRYKIDASCVNLCSKSVFNQNPISDTTKVNFTPITITIPNVFTPNSDTTNNFFTIKVENYKSYHIAIYDRWGLKLFETSDANMHWNGKPNNTGADCPDGTYYYIINLIDKGGIASNYKGFLNLFR